TAQGVRRERPVTKPLAVLDERVVQGDHRVENDRLAMSLGTPDIKLAGIAHDHRRGVRGDRGSRKAKLRPPKPRKDSRSETELVCPAPHLLVPTSYVYTRRLKC